MPTIIRFPTTALQFAITARFMAKARALDRRRKSIRSIRKITRTMELISTAQFKRAMDRATAAAAYTRRITALVGHLAHSGLEVSHPLLTPRAETRRAILLVLTANRGLCAGYNSSVLRLAIARYHELCDNGTAGSTSRWRASGAFRPSASENSRWPKRSRISTTSRASPRSTCWQADICSISPTARSTGSMWSIRSSPAPAIRRRWSRLCCRWAN